MSWSFWSWLNEVIQKRTSQGVFAQSKVAIKTCIIKVWLLLFCTTQVPNYCSGANILHSGLSSFNICRDQGPRWTTLNSDELRNRQVSLLPWMTLSFTSWEASCPEQPSCTWPGIPSPSLPSPTGGSLAIVKVGSGMIPVGLASQSSCFFSPTRLQLRFL